MFLHRTYSRIKVLVYVDDIIIFWEFDAIPQLQASLHAPFHMKDPNNLIYFLGLKVHISAQGIFINQHKYT